MTVDALGAAFYENSGMIPFRFQGGERSQPEKPEAGAFARLLEQARSAAPGEASPRPPASSAKPLIDKTDKLYEQCEALETFLVKNLIKSMRGTIQKTNLIDTGFAGEVYEDMLYDEYAKDFTKNAGLGFAEMAYLELSGRRGTAPGKR